MRIKTNRKHLLFDLLPLFFLVVVMIAGVTNVSTIREFLIGAFGQEANIQIYTSTDLGPLERPWRNLAQGGESKDWSLAPIESSVKTLSPQYIRIDHIYDFFEIVKKENNQLLFDFSKLNRIIQEIQSVGATPYLSLSYTPPALAENGDITSPPNWKEWELVIQKTIEHVSGTLNVANAYYEVWNEPDLFGNYKTYGDKNYLQMYQAAAVGAKKAAVSQQFKIGGPATTALYKNWFDAILQLSVEQDLQLDFFSWHRYSRDIDQYRTDLSQLRQWIPNHPQKQNIELHLTEWGHDSNINPEYDTEFAAIHTLAVSTELTGMLDKAFVFEIQDGVDPAGKQRWGRWGLLDSSGQPKPRYSALRFLDRLSGNRIQLLGKGSWVKGLSARDGNTISTLLVNYDSDQKHIETVPVTWKELKPGKFELEQQYFGGVNMKQTLATSSAELKIDVPMNVNSAVLLRLRPL